MFDGMAIVKTMNAINRFCQTLRVRAGFSLWIKCSPPPICDICNITGSVLGSTVAGAGVGKEFKLFHNEKI